MAKKKTPEADADRWTHESRDQTSALIEQLRGLERHAVGEVDGEWIKAADLDAVLNASIAAPAADEPKDEE